MWESAWQASGVVSRLSDCQRHGESHGGPATKEMKREVVLVDYYITCYLVNAISPFTLVLWVETVRLGSSYLVVKT